MATRFYTHSATSSVGGTLPTTKQTSLSISASIDAQTVNRSMNTTIGTSVVNVGGSMSLTGSIQYFYLTRWTSPGLDPNNISANTWTVNFALQNSDFAGDSQLPYETYVTVYIWRPSTGTKIGNVFDNTVMTGSPNYTDSGNRIVLHKTFSGSAVSGVSSGDVLCYEACIAAYDLTAGSSTYNQYYDGTTVNTTDQANPVTSHASFLETPQNLTFASAIPPVDCTVTGKAVATKQIVHG